MNLKTTILELKKYTLSHLTKEDDVDEIKILIGKCLSELEPYNPYQNDDPNIIRKRNDLKFEVLKQICTEIMKSKWDEYVSNAEKHKLSLTGNDVVASKGTFDKYFSSSINKVHYTDDWNLNEMDR